MNARLLRRGALFGVLLGALACGEEHATTEEPPRWRVLPAATVRGGVLTCAAPVAGQGPQARLTARLEVLDAQGERRYDTTVQQLQSGSVDFPAGPDTLLLLGGADPDITQDLRPGRGALEIDLASGEVRDASPHPWPTLGAAGVRLGAGVVAAAGGLLLLDPDDPTSTPGVSNAAVLWADRGAAARRCGPLGDALADDADDAGSP